MASSVKASWMWFCWMVLFQILYLVGGGCIHDEIHQRDFLTANLGYSVQEKYNAHKRTKRSPEELYRPMRIHVHFSELNRELSPQEVTRLKTIVKGTTTLVSNILSVIPVEGKLLLARSDSACTNIWSRGVNINKCSRVKHAIPETCLDHFKIPPEHLQGLYIYNYTYPEPVEQVWPEGAGLLNKDYVLYVRSISTDKCLAAGPNVIAYADYCQVDQNGRPIAGYINFCPSLLRTQQRDHKISKVALHEFFHALGFSKELFEKFRDCSQSETGLRCPTWQKPIREVLGSYRLVTSRVVELASKHFNCSTHPSQNEFGPRLQILGSEIGSHWDAAFMQGSLMAPNIGLPELTKLDPITLAAFADMGWYKVNFEFAEDYIWGEGAGCSFGKFPSCDTENSFFCKLNSEEEQKSGCHYLHAYKGFCGSNNFLHSCAIYEATSEGNCQVTSNQKHARLHEKFQPDSRCFVSNLTSESDEIFDPAARCYQHQCKDGELSLKVGESAWTKCPYGETTQIEGYHGIVECPRKGVLCLPPRPVPVPTEIPTTTKAVTPITYPPTPKPDAKTYTINITFPGANYIWLHTENLIPSFKEEVASAVAMLTNISRQRVMTVELHSKPVVTYAFDLLPSSYPGDGQPSEKVYEMLKKIVASGNLSVTVKKNGYKYVASSVDQNVGGPIRSSTSLPPDVIAGMVIGCILATLILGALVFFVQRYYAVHTRVLPSHARYEDSQALATRRQQPLDPEAAQWAAAERAHSALSTQDIHVDDQSSQFDMNDSL